jgi:hypothetical protein
MQAFVFAFAREYYVVEADKADLKKEKVLISQSRISVCTVWQYSIYDGNVTIKKFPEQIIRYDADGNKTENTTLDKQGNKVSITVFTYNSLQDPISEITYTPFGEITGSVKYSYDSLSRLHQVIRYDGRNLPSGKIDFSIDTENQQVIWRTYTAPDSLIGLTLYSYSNMQNGFLQKIESYLPKGELQSAIVYKRDSSGKPESEEHFDYPGKDNYRVDYMYDSHNLLSSKVWVYPNGKRIKMADYKFALSGLPTAKIEYNQEGDILSYVFYEYQ